MSDVSAVLKLPYLLPSQAQKHVTHNAALAMLDIAVQLAVLSRTETAPPPAAAEGARYLLPAGVTGEWAGHAGAIAVLDQGVWQFHAPQPGWRATVLAEDLVVRFDGTTWTAGEGDLRAGRLGIGTVADATNRLAVSAAATLLTHVGSGHQVKINKAGLSDTASLLFQTNWSGRAEMGLAGSNSFAIKVSGDGTAWTTALSFDPATGIASGAAVQASATDVTAGRLARADYAYGKGNLLGTVSQTAGVPTGAAIERGTGVNGDWVRFADGTQICWSPQMTVDVTTAAGALWRSAVSTWTFPKAFSVAPSLMQGRQNSSTLYWTVPGVSTTTTGEACAFSYQSITSRAINIVAIGRWF